MKIQYLGTAAAEGWPGIFCSCKACREALRLKGKNIRTRSQAIIDDTILIDLPPDTYMHMIAYGLDMPAVRTLIVTHSHQDHWYPEELMLGREGFSGGKKEILDIYGSDTVYGGLNRILVETKKFAKDRPPVAFHVIQEFQPFYPEEYEIIPLRASHSPRENCFIYIIKKAGKTLLYANDTGYFPESTWEFIKDCRFDLVSMDCTLQETRLKTGHMGIPNNVDVAERLQKMGCADGNTRYVLTHFSHNGGLLHDEMEQAAAKYGFSAAYDGMVIEF